jgi:lysophospholipase L1-like esterase
MAGDRAADRRDRGRPTTYYLSLGDSLSVGVQPTGTEERLARTDEGYADQLHALALQRNPGLRLVKLGCPSETTKTMMEGGLCGYPHGCQLNEAVAFLRRRRGKVAMVTIDIGFNDFPAQDLVGVRLGMAAVARNLPVILGRLQEAAGPSTPIVGMTLYDPFLCQWPVGPDGRDIARLSVEAAIRPINDMLRRIYRAAGCGVADVEQAFSTLDFETQVPLDECGRVPLNVARIAEWTWAAARPPLGPDFHANAAGYRAIAGAFAEVLLP